MLIGNSFDTFSSVCMATISQIISFRKRIRTWLSRDQSLSENTESTDASRNPTSSPEHWCDHVTDNDDAPNVLGGVCCWRTTWNGTDYCIWHAKETGKSTDELVAARLNRAERIDDAYLPKITAEDSIDFEDCTLWKAKFNSSRLSNANFVRCYLHGGNFSGARLNGSDFMECHANNAEFRNIEGRNSDFTNASLVRANFSTENQVAIGLVHAHFNEADLFDATFRNTNLQQADFTNSRLTHVTFVDAVPEQANFDGADVRDADFTHCKLDGAYFADARISMTTDFGDMVAYERIADRRAENNPVVAKFVLDIQRLLSYILYSPYLWLRGRRDSESDQLRHRIPLFILSIYNFCILSIYSRLLRALSLPPSINRNHNLSDSASELVSDTTGKLLQPVVQHIKNKLWATWRFYNRWSPEIGFRSSDKRDLMAAERTYRNYQSILDGTPQKDAQLNFNLREKAAQRKLAWSSGNLWKWFKLSLARWTIYHGESPWRLGAFSGGIIGIFTLLYPCYGLLIDPEGGEPYRVAYDAPVDLYTTLEKSLYFSITSFVYPGYGEIRPIGIAEYLAITETLLGALVIALLVFVLGRRASR